MASAPTDQRSTTRPAQRSSASGWHPPEVLASLGIATPQRVKELFEHQLKETWVRLEATLGPERNAVHEVSSYE